jgi:hypothetical protein
MFRYAVFQSVNGADRQVGVVLANNNSHAHTKALQLFNRRVWVERLSQHPAHVSALG